MGWNRKLSLVLFLVAVAAAGYALRTLVPTMIDEYEKAAGFSPVWGYVYLARGRAGGGRLSDAGRCGPSGPWRPTRAANDSAGQPRRRTPGQMSRRDRQAEIETHLADSRRLADDTTLSPEAREKIRRSLDDVETKLERQHARDRGLRHGVERQVVGAQRSGRARRVSHRSPRRHDRHAQRSALARGAIA